MYIYIYVCVCVIIYIGNVIVPTDDFIFFRGVETTTNQSFGWDSLTQDWQSEIHPALTMIEK